MINRNTITTHFNSSTKCVSLSKKRYRLLKIIRPLYISLSFQIPFKVQPKSKNISSLYISIFLSMPYRVNSEIDIYEQQFTDITLNQDSVIYDFLEEFPPIQSQYIGVREIERYYSGFYEAGTHIFKYSTDRYWVKLKVE